MILELTQTELTMGLEPYGAASALLPTRPAVRDRQIGCGAQVLPLAYSEV